MKNLISDIQIENKENKKLEFLLLLFFFFATIYGTLAIFIDNMYIRAIKDIWLGLLVTYILCKLLFSYRINRFVFNLGILYIAFFIVSILGLFSADSILVEWVYGIKITLWPMGMLFVGYYFGDLKNGKIIKVLSLLYVMVLLTWVIQYSMGLDRLLALGYVYAINVKNFDDTLRLPSLLGTPDSYALYVAIVSLIIQNSNLLSKRYIAKIFLIIITFIFLFLATIRTALLFWLITQAFTVVFNVIKNKEKTFLLKCSMFLIFLPTLISFVFFKMKNTEIFSLYSLTDRFTHWGVFNQSLFSSEGIIGKGLGSVGAANVRVERIGSSNWYYVVDNQFLAIYQQLGILGIIILLVFLCMILSNLFKGLKMSANREYAVYGLTISMLFGVLASCTFTNTLELYPFNILFWFYMGSILKGINNVKKLN